jgi:predicted metal-binding membrane protein
MVGHQSYHCCWTLMLLMFASGASNRESMFGLASRAGRNDITA